MDDMQWLEMCCYFIKLVFLDFFFWCPKDPSVKMITRLNRQALEDTERFQLWTEVLDAGECRLVRKGG